MIDLYSSSSNLGDNLGLTPLCLATRCRVHMYDDVGCRGVAPIFDGVAEVVFDNGKPGGESPKSNDPTHIYAPTTIRHLIHHRMWTSGWRTSAIPRVVLKPEELAKARGFVADFRSPCIIKCSPQVTDQRTPPRDLLARLVKANPDTTFLQFGLSKAHAKYNFADVTVPGVQTFYDLPIREQAAIYAVVGQYVGPDTGDYHLMLAAGGSCDVLVPPESPTYAYAFFHYNDDCWTDGPSRVRYHDWTEPLRNFITRVTP